MKYGVMVCLLVVCGACQAQTGLQVTLHPGWRDANDLTWGQPGFQGKAPVANVAAKQRNQIQPGAMHTLKIDDDQTGKVYGAGIRTAQTDVATAKSYGWTASIYDSYMKLESQLGATTNNVSGNLTWSSLVEMHSEEAESVNLESKNFGIGIQCVPFHVETNQQPSSTLYLKYSILLIPAYTVYEGVDKSSEYRVDRQITCGSSSFNNMKVEYDGTRWKIWRKWIGDTLALRPTQEEIDDPEVEVDSAERMLIYDEQEAPSDLGSTYFEGWIKQVSTWYPGSSFDGDGYLIQRAGGATSIVRSDYDEELESNVVKSGYYPSEDSSSTPRNHKAFAGFAAHIGIVKDSSGKVVWTQ